MAQPAKKEAWGDPKTKKKLKKKNYTNTAKSKRKH